MSRGLRLIPIILLLLADRRRLRRGGWRSRPTPTCIRRWSSEAGAGLRPCRRAFPAKPGLTSADLATGQPRLLNIFASWCVPCVGEAPVLQRARSARRRDRRRSRSATRPERLAAFLASNGDPYRADRQRPAEPACRSRSARRACPRPSSSMARASSATSISARSSAQPNVPGASLKQTASELAMRSASASLIALCSSRSRCSPTATCRRLIGRTGSFPIRGRKRRRRR